MCRGDVMGHGSTFGPHYYGHSRAIRELWALKEQCLFGFNQDIMRKTGHFSGICKCKWIKAEVISYEHVGRYEPVARKGGICFDYSEIVDIHVWCLLSDNQMHKTETMINLAFTFHLPICPDEQTLYS